MIPENAVSVAHRDLPDVPSDAALVGVGSIVLFYQYKEPEWDTAGHKKAIKKVIEIAEKHAITGRGRVAKEGLNCTLSGNPKDVRDFCYALREWDPVFNNTDFKITDGVPRGQLFKSLSVKKADELVAYGLNGEKAPSLAKFAGVHLEADEYHAAMADKDSVIIDVRNAYESAIGSFQPPPGGAELIDPKMRNSIEFPKWLNDSATQEKLRGKKVLMYCTGGIRCERASALLNQMAAVNPEKYQINGVYELRGGIERYIKTFPEGGNWKGKNYLFDRRMEQLPGNQNEHEAAASVNACCCLCRKKWTFYRNQFKCAQSLCGVPVIVCTDCTERATEQPNKLKCELCAEGYRAPMSMPDLTGLKRRAEATLAAATTSSTHTSTLKDEGVQDAEEEKEELSRRDGTNKNKKSKTEGKGNRTRAAELEGASAFVNSSYLLFLNRLPLTVTKSKLHAALTPQHPIDVANGKEHIVNAASSIMQSVHWLSDVATCAFYGSCVVKIKTSKAARQCIEHAANDKGGGILVDKKRIRVMYAKVTREEAEAEEEDEEDDGVGKGRTFPPRGAPQGEYPPVGH